MNENMRERKDDKMENYAELRRYYRGIKKKIDSMDIPEEEKKLLSDYSCYAIRVDRWPDGVDQVRLSEDIDKYAALTRGRGEKYFDVSSPKTRELLNMLMESF